MIDRYQQLESNPKVSETIFGLKFGPLQSLLEKTQMLHEQKLEENPISKRGLDSEFGFANQFLLTLEYLKTYQTFDVLAFNYGISKSYANKSYHKILTLLTEVIGLKNPRKITRKQVAKLIVDVSCQPIERPVAEQSKYYNRHKKTT
jgi:hypothetical protein